ncbi:MAG TPA: PadR family transcriptional regulator [Acidimicrobiales bacterium]|nr:PadR family transcriptional regulator [Acidimicrobiales bacterium]
MLELVLLGQLVDAELHGYELKKRIEGFPGGEGATSFGSLYPALNRLARAGMVEVVPEGRRFRPQIPMTGSLDGEALLFRNRRAKAPRGGRSRKAYRLTEAGRRRLIQLLNDDSVDDRVFPWKVSLVHLLGDAERERLFGRRVELLRRRRADIDQAITAGSINRYRREHLGVQLVSVDQELRWLDSVLPAGSGAPAAESPTAGASGVDPQGPRARVPSGRPAVAQEATT